MRLYTKASETEVLLAALQLLRVMADDVSDRNTCEVLIDRIDKCRELQRPDRATDRKEKHR